MVLHFIGHCHSFIVPDIQSLIMKKILSILALLFFSCGLHAQQATWIWYPGDFEINLSNKLQNKRTERNTFFPVFWKMDAHYVLMDFHKVFNLTAAEEVDIHVEGEYNVKVDGKAFEGKPSRIVVPAGKHKINIKVYNQAAVPAIFVKGKTVVSDSSWLVTFEDKEWIDETGKTSDISATNWVKAGSWNFNTAAQKPSAFALPTRPMNALSTTRSKQSLIADFGKETFGFVQLQGLKGKGRVNIYYGESKEEALSEKHAEALDRIEVNNPQPHTVTMQLAKAFRYVHVTFDAGLSLEKVSMLYEFADVKERGSFVCDDAEINRIYDVSKYTFGLNTREFFIDGIKRDRWVWSGDAYQSYLMNYYLYFDKETVKRTIFALRGKDPVTGHINTIMDYTFYWFLSIYDYYQFSGDKEFLNLCYPRMKSLMDYCLGRRNANGFMQGLPGDWIFIDWVKGLSKQGEVSFEQLLFARSLETMEICARLSDDEAAAKKYGQLSTELRKKLLSLYWDEQKQALVHSRVNGKNTEQVTRYANMFAIFFDYFNQQQKDAVKKSVLMNDSIPKITTPYMNFYELEALCAMGEQSYVTQKIKNYWGGMLKLGATSFWEEFDPSKNGNEHYAMYGREFGKSLCHAWGASPIYLFGKYYLGVKPTSPGFKTYRIDPSLGGLKWIKGTVPTPHGNISINMTMNTIRVRADEGTGVLSIRSATPVTAVAATVKAIAADKYEVVLLPGKEILINYTAVSQ
jgi:hypothetical protein